jgi:hypothetical protein
MLCPFLLSRNSAYVYIRAFGKAEEDRLGTPCKYERSIKRAYQFNKSGSQRQSKTNVVDDRFVVRSLTVNVNH